jgi:hypothetical protein
MSDNLRECWLNCYAPDDKRFLEDKEIPVINAMEDVIAPLNDEMKALRWLITRFELCYHEADKEAEYIIKSIAAGHCLEQSQERPPERKAELQNCRDILSAWCENSFDKVRDMDVGGISADTLAVFIGESGPLKKWQVGRIVERISYALDSNHIYHWLAMETTDVNESDTYQPEKYYEKDSAFFEQTRKTIIHDTVDGHKSRVSLATAIDLLMPCHWDFVGSVAAILKAIGGDLHPEKPLTCCARNIKLSPLCDRMKTISDTLQAFWKGEETAKNIEHDIISILGEPTPKKRWLAASLDKTIRLHLSLPFDVDFS